MLQSEALKFNNRSPLRITTITMLIGLLSGVTLATVFFLWLNLDHAAKASSDKMQKSGWLKAANGASYYSTQLTLNDSKWQRLAVPYDLAGQFYFAYNGVGSVEFNNYVYKKDKDPSFGYPVKTGKTYKKYARQYIWVRVFGQPGFRLTTYLCPHGSCQ